MAMKFSCPSCGKVLSATDGQAGKAAKCPSCGQTLRVPALHAPGKHRLFDAAQVFIGLGQGKRVRPRFCLSLAELNLISFAGNPMVAVGEGLPRSGWAGTVRTLTDFVGLVEAGKRVYIRLLYKVPKAFTPSRARLRFYGQQVQLPGYGRSGRSEAVGVTWHTEQWGGAP